MAQSIRVLIVDDHGIVRRGISALLSTETDIEVLGEATNGAEGVEKAEALRPDVVLMDMVMPIMDGIEATRRITAMKNGPRVLVLTSFAADDKVFPAIKAGALGYLLKDSSPDDLLHAIRSVHRGNLVLPQDLAVKLMQPQQTVAALDQLTERETDVLRLLAQGQSNQEIAVNLSISTTTVRSHVSNILLKLGVSNRTQAALIAKERQLL
jgi:DNA-binding NarL/FixJ family response regulator